jgi:hypothetical protein
MRLISFGLLSTQSRSHIAPERRSFGSSGRHHLPFRPQKARVYGVIPDISDIPVDIPDIPTGMSAPSRRYVGPPGHVAKALPVQLFFASQNLSVF